MAILGKKASESNVELPADVTLFLATQSESSIRELEGYLLRVSAYASLTKRPINIDMAKQVLRQLLSKNEKKELSVEDILKVVCSQFNVKIAEIKSAKKNKNLVEVRQISTYLAREMTNLSFPDIGEKIGGRDHSTAIYSYNKIKGKLESDKQLIETVENIKGILINKN
jgi:chromosomal replication initiator protein